MPVLFNDARSITRPRGRATTGLWLSVGLHVVVAVVLIVIPIGATGKPSVPAQAPIMRSTRVFVLPAADVVKIPPPVVPRRPPDPPPPPPPVRELARVEPPKPRPVEPPVARRVEPPPARLVPEPVPVVEPPKEKPVSPRPPEVGLFERTSGVRTTQSTANVTTGGFGSAAASPRDGNAAAAVTTGGFGGSAPAARRANDPGEVQTAGFDERASAPARRAAAATAPVERPVEIVFKPTPEYTDEARSARIEGTVSLELEFTATGEVRVLRVVRGLGHGLDEAAQRAALRMRFTPAQSGGRAVDSRATVHITFRLS